MKEPINRKEYYSQTEVLKLFKVTPAEYDQLLLSNGITPVIKAVDLGTYIVTAKYVLRKEVENLNLQPKIRQPRRLQ